jgi:hypothetical protein
MLVFAFAFSLISPDLVIRMFFIEIYFHAQNCTTLGVNIFVPNK